ncbi:MAG: hypothetical protein DBY38_04380 [Clostridium cadaveris]|uniref:Uncharacterized protein n=1 Tax=Clostridium cadaveris TaxID=1529 RepID=A0A316MD07_9CLOT|nr:hypothetical protein [Clostridium sp.]NWK11299.1 hypothetical protein [Clostridium cadaveris]PWL54433.1 MAG: hypothetical protein DBY38_04380 [Clostridium cadaveris]
MKSESQKKADKKWESKNREYANYLRSRSTARSFINKKATLEDIEELRELLNKREEFLNVNK